MKFTPEGGRITVRGRASRGCVIIAIADTGIGIPRDALEKLGRPFEQVESQLTKSHQGSGLGFAIAQIARRAAWRRDAHPLDAGARHDRAGAAAGSDRAVRPRRGRDGGGLTSERTVRTALVNCCTVTLVRADAWIMSAGR